MNSASAFSRKFPLTLRWGKKRELSCILTSSVQPLLNSVGDYSIKGRQKHRKKDHEARGDGSPLLTLPCFPPPGGTAGRAACDFR